MQRWAADSQSLRKITPEGDESPPWDEVVVKYADHVAALAEARAKWADIGRDAGYDEGYAKALGKARESYPELKAQILADTRAAVLPLVCNYNGCEARARAAIDALAAGQAPAAPGEVT